MSENELASVKQLENLPLVPLDKAAILLVHGGLKPSALIAVPGSVSKDTKPVDPQLLSDLKDVLSGLQMLYEVRTVEIDHCVVYRFFIARNSEGAKLLESTFNHEPRDEIEVGRLLGYPESATRAYLSSEMLEISKTPLETESVSASAMQFLNHRLSKENWQEEVKYLETYSNYILRISPSLWKKITS
jgi:hypothetical protein